MKRRRSVLIDTNLLVLLVVGLVDRNLIAKHPRTSSFRAEDYDLLDRVLRTFGTVVLTPNILTEAGNLLGHGPKSERARLLGKLAALFDRTSETYVKSSTASSRREFLRLGLTDAGIGEVADDVDCVLTEDLALYLSILNQGRHALNFNHLRTQEWFG